MELLITVISMFRSDSGLRSTQFLIEQTPALMSNCSSALNFRGNSVAKRVTGGMPENLAPTK